MSKELSGETLFDYAAREADAAAVRRARRRRLTVEQIREGILPAGDDPEAILLYLAAVDKGFLPRSARGTAPPPRREDT